MGAVLVGLTLLILGGILITVDPIFGRIVTPVGLTLIVVGVIADFLQGNN